MIIGNGDIAQALNDRRDITFFASGVSDSSCEDPKEFQREIQLLYEQPRYQMLVYFSTLDQSQQTKYVNHKKIMERYVTALFPDHVIIKIGNIDFGNNPKTFLNYLRAEIKAGRNPEIREEIKYLTSKKQLLFITDNLPTRGQNEISIFGRMDLVKNLL